jgi:uncharacterized protein YbjT (DUF2867 family)
MSQISTPTAENSPTDSADRQPTVLLTGATGYVGGRLLERLGQLPLAIRCLVRSPDKLSASRSKVRGPLEIQTGDIRDPRAVRESLTGVQTAYYMVHLMAAAGGEDFERQDREAAQIFANAAREAGVQRIIYLGGLGNSADPHLSPHLRSRHEVGSILRDSGVETIEFRASLVIGTGSLSFDLVQSLTNRLPIMLCPKWLTTPTQPIAIQDVLEYLVAAQSRPAGSSAIFEVGCSDQTTYGGMILEYARQRGLRRHLIYVPVLTPNLSSLWLALVTPTAFTVGRHLIEGLKNPTIVTDRRALSEFTVRPMSIREAIQQAIA